MLITLPNTAITPSPVFFTSVPRCVASASRTTLKCARRCSSHACAPVLSISAVEPTMSVNITEMVPVVPILPTLTDRSRPIDASASRARMNP